MGTFSGGDWRSTLRYTSSNPSFPIELFLQCMEHEATTQKMADQELIRYAVGFLDSTEFQNSDSLLNYQTWHELKSHLIKALSRESTVSQKVQMLKSLTKGPSENCQHYLIRAKYVATVLRSINNEECIKILFLAGLEDYEKEFCDVNKVGNLEVLAELLNLNIRTDSPKEDQVKVECTIRVKAEEEEDADYVFPDEAVTSAAQDDYDDDSEDEPLSKHLVKPEISVKDEVVKDSKFKRGEARACKYCNVMFSGFMLKDLADHQAECPKRVFGKPKPCKFCGDKIRAKNMKTHLKICDKNTKNEKVKCQLCNEDVVRSLFQKHIKKFHKGNTLSCSTCGEKVKNQTQLERHVRLFHQDDRGKEVDQWAAEGKITVDKHPPKTEPLSLIEPVTLEERTKERRVQFQCAICKEVIAGSSEFSVHIKKVHDGKRFTCDLCPYASNKALCVYDHRLKIHNVISGNWTVYQCNIESGEQMQPCRFKTVCLFAISTHVRQTHLRRNEYKCQVCSKVFYSNGTLKMHTETVHMGIRKFPCPKCDIQCNDQRGLDTHMQTHLALEDRQTFVCEECGQSYMNVFTLKAHVRRVHRAEKKKECPHCPGKMFYCTSLLKRHLRSVHQMEVDGKSYKCEHCQRHFQNKYHLDGHIQVAHLKIKSFRCKLCNTLFSKAVNLTYHIGVKHMGLTPDGAKGNRDAARAHEAYEVLGPMNAPGHWGGNNTNNPKSRYKSYAQRVATANSGRQKSDALGEDNAIKAEGPTPSQAAGNRDATRNPEAYEVLGSGNGEHYGMMTTAKSRNTIAGNGNTAEDVDIKPDPMI